MKRAVLIVAAAALCVAGSAVAQDHSGQVIGSGYAASQVVGSGYAASQVFGSGYAAGQTMGSGGRAADNGPLFGSGGGAASMSQTMDNGGYMGSGLDVSTVPLFDGFGLLVVTSDEGAFVVPIGD